MQIDDNAIEEVRKTTAWQEWAIREVVGAYLAALPNKHPLPDGLRGIANYLPPLDDLPTQNPETKDK